jgi:hypothetical protein
LIDRGAYEFGAQVPAGGDFDNDGDVDGRDFLVWQRDPGVGNLADWQANYGGGALTVLSGHTVAEATSPVPEPSALFAFIFGFCGLSTRRRLSS